jgi:ParB family chromosome partitioning protein
MATENVLTLTVDPKQLDRNPENPRLIFRADDLKALEESIAGQGILVPLTVYKDGRRYKILDGERRWRCALKLGLPRVPAIVQPKPDRLQNIMMMFAIHNARRDWDPLPTAFKLRELESIFTERRGRLPKEAELAEIASMQRGEVRRLKKLLSLPQEYIDELLAELEKPRSAQKLTVDHVLETTKGVQALVRRGVIDENEEDQLRKAIIEKFRSGTLRNTVAPRLLARIARAVEREEVSSARAKKSVMKLITDPSFTIDEAFEQTAAQSDLEHSLAQLAVRLEDRVVDHLDRYGEISDELRSSLVELRALLDRLLG